MSRGRPLTRRFAAFLTVAAALSTAVSAAAVSTLDPERFPVPASLEPNVRFWTDIYSRYSGDEAVIHDEVDLAVVYSVVALPPRHLPGRSDVLQRRARLDIVDSEKERIVAILRGLAAGPPKSPEEHRIAALFAHQPGGRERFAQATRTVRAQTGLEDRFEEAIVTSGRYMPGIERIFEAEGLPRELSRLPFVESMFVNVALSKVGASGAWQFMPSTARLYLQMNSAVDSRVDVLLAAEGAATMLRHDYEKLGTWPLALTAYNHGQAGMTRAVRQLGTTDIGTIVEKYSSRRFGFASRNFYAEFVAAATVYDRRKELFPDVEPAQELRFDEFHMPAFASLVDLSEGAGLEMTELRELNPALNSDVFAGTLLVPRTYRLRVPPGTASQIEGAFHSLPPDRVRTAQLQVGYQVRSGDTVGAIARRFGTSVGAIQRANNMTRPDRIYIGQYLRIPGQSLGSFDSPASASPRPVIAEGGTHVVRRGENLSRIASRYGRSVDEIVAANSLSSANQIQIGQRLDIPSRGGGSSGDGRHVVQRGDSLSRIAQSYGVSVNALKAKNALDGSVIHPGQVLTIP